MPLGQARARSGRARFSPRCWRHATAGHGRGRPASQAGAGRRPGEVPGRAGSLLAPSRGQLARCHASPDPRASARPIPASARPARRLAGWSRRRRRDLSWPYRSAHLRSSCSRWRASSSLTDGACACRSPLVISVAAGLLCGHGRVTAPRSHPRAGAMTARPVTSAGGDCRRGRAPWPGRHPGLAGRAVGPHPSRVRAGPWASGYGCFSLSSPRPVAMSGPGQQVALVLFADRFFEGRYEPAPQWGVTRRCACGWNLRRPPRGARQCRRAPLGHDGAAGIGLRVPG